MTKSRARQFAELLSGGAGGGGSIAPALVSDQANTSTGYFDLPAGTTAQRPANSNTGYVRFNTTLDQLEQYTSDSGWQGISPPPVYTGVDVTNLEESDTSQTLVVTGSNFDITATAVLIDANGVIKTPTTVTRNSSTQLTIVYSGGNVLTSGVPDPLSIRVTNGSGLSSTADNVITIDATPVWTTGSGSVGTIVAGQSMTPVTLSATDPEGSTVTYSVVSGGLPSGVSLSSSGSISGTPATADYNTNGPVQTHYFDVGASDGTGNTTTRAFAIIRQWYDGSTSALAAPNATAISALGLTTGQYYIRPSGASTAYYCDVAIGTSSSGGAPSGNWVKVLGMSGSTGWGSLHRGLSEAPTTAYNTTYLSNNNHFNTQGYNFKADDAWLNAFGATRMIVQSTVEAMCAVFNGSGSYVTIPNLRDYYFNVNCNSANAGTVHAWLAANARIYSGQQGGGPYIAGVWNYPSQVTNHHYGWSTQPSGGSYFAHMLHGGQNSTTYPGFCLGTTCWDQSGALWLSVDT